MLANGLVFESKIPKGKSSHLRRGFTYCPQVPHPLENIDHGYRMFRKGTGPYAIGVARPEISGRKIEYVHPASTPLIARSKRAPECRIVGPGKLVSRRVGEEVAP